MGAKITKQKGSQKQSICLVLKYYPKNIYKSRTGKPHLCNTSVSHHFNQVVTFSIINSVKYIASPIKYSCQRKFKLIKIFFRPNFQ